METIRSSAKSESAHEKLIKMSTLPIALQCAQKVAP